VGRLSELEEFLQEHIAEGSYDSAGQFTLSRDKALEKLAAFQLPRATAWVLKVVQAAVAGHSDGLYVHQTSTDTEFLFAPPQAWTLDRIEAAFYDPEVSGDDALDHLKRALWSVSLSQMRPFRMALPGCPNALLWTGREFRKLPAQPPKWLTLTVSHRSVEAGKGVIILRSLQAARTNSEILAELVHHAFVCPIPLKVDNRRLDALQGCPNHGSNPHSYPIRLGFAGSEGPPFAIPKLTLGHYQPSSPGNPYLASILDRHTEVPRQVQVAMLLSARVEPKISGKSTTLTAVPQESAIHWVLDGVIVQRKTLMVPRMAVSCALFASAQGLGTDLTGFQLTQDEHLEARQEQLCRAITPVVRGTKVSLDKFVRGSQKFAYAMGGFLFLGGVAVSMVSPAGLFLMGGGLMGGAAVTVAVELSAERALDREIRKELERLRAHWSARWPAGSVE
jgi:hypothetical protein